MKATAVPSAHPIPSQPRDVVLHIGSGKTGTSSVQRFMAHNRERLADSGLLYPRTPGPRRHFRLGLYIKRDAELHNQLTWHKTGAASHARFRRRFERRFVAELDDSRAPRVLLTDEALYGSSPAAVERLRALTDRISRSLRIVVYLRRQDDHLCSRYQEVVKRGAVRRFRERVEMGDFAHTYDYHARLTLWQRTMEPTDFVVRAFDPTGFVDGSLYQDFLDAAGIGARADDLEEVETVNESLDAESVEFLRILNVYRVRHDGAEPGLIDNRKILGRLSEASTGPTLTLPGDVLDSFMARWERSNQAVAREFLGDDSGLLFRSPRKSRGTTTDQHLDPARLDHFLALVELPESTHAPLRRLVEREAQSHRTA